jgi:hypothetical protein
MKLRHHAMEPRDIREYVDLVANHPIIGPRYGPMIEHLPEAWLRVLPCEAFSLTVFRAGEGANAPVCVLGGSAIVHDDFLREMKTPPHFWFGRELTRRIVTNESPLLTDKQLRDANSRGGLNLVCWETCFHPTYAARGELQRYAMGTFIEIHRGYLWKEVVCQPDGPDHLDFCLQTGGYLWDARQGGYTSTLKKTLGEIVAEPHVVGTTRDLERKRNQSTGSWVGALFDYHPPMLGLSRSEQRLLSCALPGETDEQVAEDLDISLSAVKKMWVSIYRRVEDCLPEMIADPLGSDSPVSGRGREKRRRLLAYLREHPEELRPVSRVQQNS